MKCPENTPQMDTGLAREASTRALIVSGDLEDRKTLARVLVACGFDLVLCLTASEAEAAIESEPVHLIFCQETLLENGLRRVLRAACGQKKNIPVIACSRFYSTRAYLDAMSCGAYDFVICPYQQTDVAWIAQSALRNAGQASRWAAQDAA